MSKPTFMLQHRTRRWLAVVAVCCGATLAAIAGRGAATSPQTSRESASCPPSPTVRRGSVLVGDLDGDGSPDRIWLVVHSHAPARCRYALVATVHGSTLTAPVYQTWMLHYPTRIPYPRLLMLAGIDGVGTVAVVPVDGGASTQAAALFRVIGGRIERLRVSPVGSGWGNAIPFGGDMNIAFSFDCAGPQRIVESNAQRLRPGKWSVARSWNVLEGSTFAAAGSQKETVTGDQLPPEFDSPSRLYELPFAHCALAIAPRNGT